MSKIKLLIIEDDKKAIENYKDTIVRMNRTSDDYRYYFAKNLEEANEHIEYYKLDSAIVDLNLSGENNDLKNDDGNEVIDKLIKSFRIPIFVVSGEPQKLAEKYKKNNLVSLITRGDKTTHDILISIKENYNSPTIQYFSRNGFLETKINDFYWTNLQHTLNSWNKVAIENPDEIDKILSRHTVSCLNEQLYVNGNIGSFDKYHPGEMYINPPIKEHYHTGDIIEKDTEKFIILNPACDIVNVGNLEFYLVSKLITVENLKDISDNIKPDAQNPSLYENLNKKGKQKFDHYKHNKSQRYHFLPQFDIIENNYVIDFQNLKTIKIGNIQEDGNYLEEREFYIKEYKKLASISSPFLKDVIVRFSSLYSRQGQPNLLN